MSGLWWLKQCRISNYAAMKSIFHKLLLECFITVQPWSVLCINNSSPPLHIIIWSEFCINNSYQHQHIVKQSELCINNSSQHQHIVKQSELCINNIYQPQHIVICSELCIINSSQPQYCQNPNSTISSIQLSLRLDYILTL